MPKRDYYVVLGVGRTESPDGIRSAFRELVRRYHPDRAGPSGTRFYRDVVEAYDVLSDAEQRSAYDRGLRHSTAETTPVEPTVVTPGPSRPRPVAEPLVPDRVSLLRDFHVTQPSFDEVFDRFLANFTQPERRPGSSLDVLPLQIVVSRAQALHGGLLELGVPVFYPCARCRGSGWYGGVPCQSCGGDGLVQGEEPVRVHIPPGVPDGTEYELPLRGLGIHDMHLVLKVRVTG